MNRYDVVVIQRRRHVVEAETGDEAERLAADPFADNEPAVILDELVVSCNMMAEKIVPDDGPWG